VTGPSPTGEELRTSRLTLRRPVVADVEAIFATERGHRIAGVVGRLLVLQHRQSRKNTRNACRVSAVNAR
jgi:hypothetical protein